MSGLDGQPKQLWLMTKDIQPRRKRMSCWGGMVGHCYPFWKGQCVHVAKQKQSFCAGQSSQVPLVPFWLKHQGHLKDGFRFLHPPTLRSLVRSPQSDVRVGWSTKTTLVNDKGHPTTSKKNELLGWDGWPLLSLLERAMCACPTDHHKGSSSYTLED